MRQLRGNGIVLRLFLAFPVALLVLGCATLPPARPIQDLKSLAGEWAGEAQPAAGPPLSVTLTISPDGTYQSRTPNGVVTGVMRLSDGKIVSRSSRGVSGTATLHEADGNRVLRIISEDGLTAVLRPAK